SNGDLLIAFTAFFVGWVASRFWRIVCRLFHQYYSTGDPRDALHHQRLAILRNSETAESGLWGFSALYLSWRGSSRQPFMRSLPTVSTAVFCVCAFATASGFSSRISTGIGNEILLQGAGCGLPNRDATAGPANVTGVNLINAYRARLVRDAENYARQCYSPAGQGSGIFDCDRFVVNQLPISINENAPCPFDSDVCRSNTSNLLLDTGYLDSHVHLGLNAPPDERILFRHVYHCAPLKTEGRSINVTIDGEDYTKYYYGSMISGPGDNLTLSNYTFQAQSLDTQYTKKKSNPQSNYGGNFILVHIHSVSMNGTVVRSESGFIPGPEIHRSDGDVKVIFLVGNGVYFDEPTDDAWYQAHTPGAQAYYGLTAGLTQEYQSDEAASPMGCVEQFQYCNPSLPEDRRCGPLASFYDASLQAAPMFGLTPEDLMNNMTADDPMGSRYIWLANYLSSSATLPPSIIQALGARVLLSQQTLHDGYQTELPKDQWKLDVTHWWSTWLASLQAGYASTATGPQDPVMDDLLILPGDATQLAMCNSQKIQSTEYASFSLFGLCFIFLIGAAIIGMSYALDSIFEWFERRRKCKGHGSLEWKTNEILHLQRMGFESMGCGSWVRRVDSNATTIGRASDTFTTDKDSELGKADMDKEKKPDVRPSDSGHR
ncbi:hypothetical protein GQ53DRAFT_358234, partial [Thozetella sp. PMI_491]